MALAVEIVVDRAGERRTYRAPAEMVAVDAFSVSDGEVRVEGIDGRGRRLSLAAEEVAAAGSGSPMVVAEPLQDLRLRVDDGPWTWVRADERGEAALPLAEASLEVRCATPDGVLRRASVRL